MKLNVEIESGTFEKVIADGIKSLTPEEIGGLIKQALLEALTKCEDFKNLHSERQQFGILGVVFLVPLCHPLRRKHLAEPDKIVALIGGVIVPILGDSNEEAHYVPLVHDSAKIPVRLDTGLEVGPNIIGLLIPMEPVEYAVGERKPLLEIVLNGVVFPFHIISS